MCGRYHLLDLPEIEQLAEQLGVRIPAGEVNIAPGAAAPFVIETSAGRQVRRGIWSMLIEPKPDHSGFRPKPGFSTFNARADALSKKPMWRQRFKHQRAIVPATGFHEWTGAKGARQCHDIRGDSAMAFAGLYEFWELDGHTVPAFTIVTTASPEAFKPFNPKSVPVMLRAEEFDNWLNPELQDTEQLGEILAPRLPIDLTASAVDSPQTLNGGLSGLECETRIPASHMDRDDD